MTLDTITNRITEIQLRLSGGATPASTSTSMSMSNGLDSSTSFADTLNNALSGLSGISSIDDSSITGNLANGLSGNSVVQDAMQYLGVPYKWGGTDPSTGLDCSGLVQQAYSDLGIKLPRVAADQAKQGTPVASLAQAQPGDLVAFDSPVDHIGIYVGDNKMIVAPKKGDVVKIEDVYKTPTAIRRIIPSSTAGMDSISQSGGFGTSLLNSLSSGSLGLGSSSTSSGSSLQSSFTSLFQQAGAKYGISANMLAAVAKQESGFNANAVSKAGAQGLMQLMPGTAKSLGVNPLNAAQAIDGAARMLAGLPKQFGSISLALAAYNAGPGAVQKYGGIPPYAETQNYVKNVLSYAQQSSNANGAAI